MATDCRIDVARHGLNQTFEPKQKVQNDSKTAKGISSYSAGSAPSCRRPIAISP
jgi:hypothetical protein